MILEQVRRPGDRRGGRLRPAVEPVEATDRLAALRAGRDRRRRWPCCAPGGSTTGPATRAAPSSASSPPTTGRARGRPGQRHASRSSWRCTRSGSAPATRSSSRRRSFIALGQLHRRCAGAARSSPTSTATARTSPPTPSRPSSAPRTKRDPRASTSPAGRATWTPILAARARQHDLKVIEDCAQAHGARTRAARGLASATSPPSRSARTRSSTTAGEGGMLADRRPRPLAAAWSFKDHGKSWIASTQREHPPGFRWLHESFGTNWRMTEMQAAIGRAAARASCRLARRRAAATPPCLTAALADLPVPPRSPRHRTSITPTTSTTPSCAPTASGPAGTGTASWRRSRPRACPASPAPARRSTTRRRSTRAGLQPPSRLPVARELGATSLMLLVDHTLDEGAIRRTAAALRQVLAAATR